MRFVALVTLFVLPVLTIASVASSQPQTFHGTVRLGIQGWGNVQARGGFGSHPIIRCRGVWCRGGNLVASAEQVTLAAKPYKGWKFTSWRGPCRGLKTMPKCVIDLARLHADHFHQHVARLRATFVAVP